MMFLVDTNIFLEILLNQDKAEDCKNFLENNAGTTSITDFSLHSVGISLFKHEKEDVFEKFVNDVLSTITICSLPGQHYKDLIHYHNSLNLDFDDAYQYTTSKCYGMKIVTMDADFEKTRDHDVIFL